ncbi:MAG TPA: TadE/TadG family type IV pilus assembly protein [Acidimicrobiales bacterium]|nr:TadE/TadG family type IV pilus assembly protein [Acidimicrobiales bacterium]
MTAELAVLAPLVMMFTLLAVGLGRYQTGRMEVTDAAHAGAEAASVASTAQSATPAAVDAASAALVNQPHLCPNPEVDVDTSRFVPGGLVDVTVVCQVGFSDVFVPGFPGSVTVHVTQSAPVDPYRMVG